MYECIDILTEFRTGGGAFNNNTNSANKNSIKHTKD